MVLGDVKKGVMHWDPAFDHECTNITLVADGKVQMDLMGEMHVAEFLPGPPVELRWSDGEVWVQMNSLQAMRTHPSDLEIQRSGSCALANLSYNADTKAS